MKKTQYPNLRAEMLKAGLSVSDLAARLGKSPSSVYAQMRGDSDFSLKQALAIKKLLKTSTKIETLFANEV